MTRKELAIELSKLLPFETPVREQEQYTTDSDIAATILWQANLMEWLKGKKIVDLGAGTGTLGIGCILMGASDVTFVEKDMRAITALKKNMDNVKNEFEIGAKIHVKHADAEDYGGKADLVIMNPPFGTQKKGADAIFLNTAFLTAARIITMHKAETRRHIDALAAQHAYAIKLYQEFSFPLRNTMPGHRKRVERIRVGCWFLEKGL